jgi:ABC-2 type transport system permease protein
MTTMKKAGFLLALEWKKYKGNKTMLVFLIATLALYPIALMLTHAFTTNIIPDEAPIDLFKYPDLWLLSGYVANWITYFFIVLMGMHMITLEYSSKTMRQNLITGLTRSEFLFSKVLFIATAAVVLTIWYALTTILFGWYAGSEIELQLIRDWKPFLLHFAMVFAYGFTGLFFGLFFKVLALSFILFFIYASFIEPIFSRVVHYRIFGDHSYLYYPANAFKDLLPFPFYSNLTEMMPPEDRIQFALESDHALIATAVYLGIMFFFTWRKMQKGNF